jgi:hypothetical protein
MFGVTLLLTISQISDMNAAAGTAGGGGNLNLIGIPLIAFILSMLIIPVFLVIEVVIQKFYFRQSLNELFLSQLASLGVGAVILMLMPVISLILVSVLSS